MSIPCRNTADKLGLFVEALSGEVVQHLRRINPVCVLRDRTDIKHVVIVKNLRVYPGAVKCVGRIHGDPNNIKFAAHDPGVSETHWEASIARVSLVHTFSHVSLLGKTPGEDEVEASVTVSWPEPNKRDTIRVSIRVTA
jgi:hypothetical protein